MGLFKQLFKMPFDGVRKSYYKKIQDLVYENKILDHKMDQANSQKDRDRLRDQWDKNAQEIKRVAEIRDRHEIENYGEVID